MVYVLVLICVVAPMLAVFLGQGRLERRRRSERGWVDDADPMSWRSPRDALILLAAGFALVVGAIGIFAIRAVTS